MNQPVLRLAAGATSQFLRVAYLPEMHIEVKASSSSGDKPKEAGSEAVQRTQL
jgi:hypothetical protein